MLKKIILCPLVLFMGCASPDDVGDLSGLDDVGDAEGPDYIDETTPSGGKADDGSEGYVSDYCHAAAVSTIGKIEKANYQRVKITSVKYAEPGLWNADYLRVGLKRASGTKWIDDSWMVHFSDSGDEEGGCEIFGARNEKRVPELDTADRVTRTITAGCKYAATKAAQRLEAQNGWSGKVATISAIAGGEKKYPVLEVAMKRPNTNPEAFPDAEEIFASAYVVSTEPSGTAGCRVWAIQDVDSIFGPEVLGGGGDEDDEEDDRESE